MTDVEISFDDLFVELFNKPPRKKNEITISFDTSDLKELYERLLELFVEGLKIKYGDLEDRVDLTKLTIDDLNLMNSYMNSFGINAHYELLSHEEFLKKYPIFINYKHMISSHLVDYKYYFIVNEMVYVFYFSL